MKISLPQIPYIIAIVSGKGGVGKSTFSFILSSLLALKKAKIGLLDADIYGPSIPKMLNITDKPTLKDKKFIPFEKNNLKAMSIGFLIDAGTPLIWRGPMVQTAIKQLFQDVDWGSLDLLVVDMPPGTGDAHLTLAQSIPLIGVIVITTPQEIAALDAAKSLQMYQKMQVPILGVVENMKCFICPCCKNITELFPGNAGKELSTRYSVPYLGSIPFDPCLTATIESDRPLSLPQPIQDAYLSIMEKLRLV